MVYGEISVIINIEREIDVQNKSEKLAVNVGICLVANPVCDGDASSEGASENLLRC